MTSTTMTGNAIQEALEPFAMCGDILNERDGWDESDTLSLFTTDDFGDADCLIQTFKVRDLRRARTAYDAIGSGVKADTCFECSGPLNGPYCPACAGEGTHTAAGAGPVGEAVTRRDMASAPKDGTIIDLWHEELGRQAECYWGKPEHCCGEAGQYCDSDWHREPEGWVHTAFNDVPYDADCFTHWMPSPAGPGAARPVEPGEVERDEAPQTDGGFLTKGERAAIDKLGEATALRRELAEARGLIRDAIGLVPLGHQNWHTDARTALGDAQEVGR